MSGHQQEQLKITRHAKSQGTAQSEETKQESVEYPDTTQILELSDREFKVNIVNMLRAFMEKVGNM